MNEDLVTVGTFPDVAIAYLAKGRLEEAGIISYLANENTGGWLLGMPTSWPKLQVSEQDALRAIAVLEGHFGPEPADEEPPEGGIMIRDRFTGFREREEPEAEANVPAATEEEERPAIDKGGKESRSASAVRAFRAALIGLLFAPVVLFQSYLIFLVAPVVVYSIYLLVRVWESQEPLSESARWRAWAAVWLNACVVLGTAVLIRLVLVM